MAGLKKFSNKVEKMDINKIQQLERDLQYRVGSNKLRFSTRVVNFFKSVALAAGTSAAAMAIEGQVAHGNAQKGFNEAREGERSRTTFIGGATSLGTVIGGTILLNKRSKRIEAKKLDIVRDKIQSFQQAENDRRAGAAARTGEIEM